MEKFNFSSKLQWMINGCDNTLFYFAIITHQHVDTVIHYIQNEIANNYIHDIC